MPTGAGGWFVKFYFGHNYHGSSAYHMMKGTKNQLKFVNFVNYPDLTACLLLQLVIVDKRCQTIQTAF